VDKSQRLRQDAELHSQTKTNKHQLARSAWQHDLAEKFGADFFAEALDVFGRYPKFVERATAAELRSPGTGCVSAMISLKRVLGGSE
jgi:hypothetical protein